MLYSEPIILNPFSYCKKIEGLKEKQLSSQTLKQTNFLFKNFLDFYRNLLMHHFYSTKIFDLSPLIVIFSEHQILFFLLPYFIPILLPQGIYRYTIPKMFYVCFLYIDKKSFKTSVTPLA